VNNFYEKAIYKPENNFAAIYVFAPHVSAVPFQMAHFIQFLGRRMTKTSKMLPTVAAVLPAEKLNETLVK
jgi:hypothetical protein